MKRPFLTFLALVVLPATGTIFGAERIATTAWSDLEHSADAGVARLTFAALDQDLGVAVAAVMERAELVAEPDTTLPAVQAALAGDTVTGLDPHDGAVDVFVLVPDAEPGRLRFANGRMEPGAATMVGRITGYHVGLYLDGRLWSASAADALPALLDERTLTAAAVSPDGIRHDGGAIVVMDARPGTAAAIVAFAYPARPRAPAVPNEMRLVMGLLLVFSMLAAWIQLARIEADPRKLNGGALFLLTTVPVLSAVVFLIHVDRRYGDDAAPAAVTQALSRALGVTTALGWGGSPDAVHQATGFHAAIISAGSVAQTTLPGDASALASLPTPPPSFLTSGQVESPLGPSRYAARRLDQGRTMIAIAPEPIDAIASVRARLRAIGGLLLAWIAALGGVLAWRTGKSPRASTAF